MKGMNLWSGYSEDFLRDNQLSVAVLSAKGWKKVE